jgi:hypothetical protein
MTIKHSRPHGTTRKNKRMMSGGKGKISKYTQRFKKQYKRFIGINDADEKGKMEKMEIWGKMNGIYKFLKADKETYKGSEGNQVSGLEKMKENIQAADNSSNKEGYIKAIDCLQNGDGTILSGTECVSYDEFVNGGGAPAAVEEEGKSGEGNAPVVGEEDDAANNDASSVAEDDANTTAVEGEGEVKVESEDADANASVADANANADADANASVADANANASVADANANADDDDDNNTAAALNTATAATVADADANATVADANANVEGQGEGQGEDKVKPEEEKGGGGRSRRHTKPSRRIKSRKSKKGRMTRRKHRSSGRR